MISTNRGNLVPAHHSHPRALRHAVRGAVAALWAGLVLTAAGPTHAADQAPTSARPQHATAPRLPHAHPRKHPSKRTERVRRAFKIAAHQKGDPYVYGADGPGAFDCSGLVQYSYRRAHLPLPRTSAAQAQAAHPIARQRLRRGDLMFFTSRGHVYHVGLFAGRRRGTPLILHAPEPGRPVQIDPVWTNAWHAETLRPRR